MGVTLHVIISLLTLIRVFGSNNDAECPSPQYIELGSVGIVECTFQDGFYGVVWYERETFLSSGHSFLQFINGEKNGEGYASGEFDVDRSGSLVIRNVSLQHERSFTVSIFESEGEVPVSLDVKVVVTVKPSKPFPVINLCGERSNTCFMSLQPDFNVTCFVKDTRPHVPLSWLLRSASKDTKIIFQNTITENGHLFTSKANTSGAFSHSWLLSLLVCKADSVSGFLTATESTIFIENSYFNFSALKPETKVIERGSRLKLICSKNNTSMIVWKKAKKRLEDEFRMLCYAAHFAKNVSRTYSEDYLLQHDGSLLIPQVQAKHEAFYGCISQSSSTSNTALFHVLVFVAAFPVVHGCTDDQICILKKPPLGSLTCSVTGVRPRTDLEWNVLDEKDSSVIYFTDHQVTVRNEGDVYDIILTSRYQVQNKRTDVIKAECRMTSPYIGVLTSSAKFVLFTDQVQTTDEPAPRDIFPLWVLAIIVALVALVILLLVLYLRRGRRQKQQTSETNTEENIPMTSSNLPLERPESEKIPEQHTRKNLTAEETTMLIPSPTEDETGRIQKQQKKENITKEEVPTTVSMSSPKEDKMDNEDIFLQELKTKYSIQYEEINPIPYIRDGYCCVNDIFVEGGFTKLTGNDNRGKWEKLNSYHDVFDKSNVSKRTIIESNPGYGKSTLALQLAYDWCNSTEASPLADINMLILLKLRHLSKGCSIFQAIKKFLLPRDSPLCEKDIELVMRESKSTVIILDGYDEYSGIETDNLSDIESMIRRDMFQQKFVILTTRSFMLPESYPPRTNRIRLTGFDEKARDAYIVKAVVGDSDTESKHIINQRLRENPVLRSLCQVPLFFVMYAHMTHESKTAGEIRSVTSFFRYMIACFHAHLNNKMKTKNVRELTRQQSEQDALGEVAFDGLKTKTFVWDKGVLYKRLGGELYNHYKQLGILVEEVTFDGIDYAGEIRCKTEVRFFHKLFCEWYAASCLSREVIKKESNLTDILQKIDPINYHYVYRFACGLNIHAAQVITSHLNKTKGAETFAILCSLEQSGDFHKIKETVSELCSDYVAIDKNDSNLLQCSTLQLLEMGSSNQIPIPFLWLRNCVKKVDLSSQSIILKSNLNLHAMSNVREIAIVETEMILEEAMCSNVLTFSSLCTGLDVLRFCCFEEPKPVQKIDNDLSVLESRSVTVLWITNEDDYCLNLLNGNWQKYDPSSSKDVFKRKNSARKKLLKDLIQEKYKELVSNVPQSPKDCDKTFSVDQIFVEGVLQRLISKDGDDNKKKTDTWEPLPSYKDILKDRGGQGVSKRYILESKAGFGKSTLALRMASDWYNNTPPFSKFDMLFLVQLSMENICSSIYKQLKFNVLPKNSPLGCGDIKNIAQEFSSILMVLDDYNLISDYKIKEKSELMSIIKGNIFENHHVIITSRCVPQECETGAQRFRLLGFNLQARDEYIEKAVGRADLEVAEKIKRELQDSPARNLCEIPLFLALFVHEKHENNNSEIFKSVKSSFTHCIECLHSHLQNKRKLKSVTPYEISQQNHLKLGKIAYNGVIKNGEFERTAWDKEMIVNEISEELYEQAVRAGIFDEHGHNVTFVHKLLYEWYAAHYLANYTANHEGKEILDTEALKILNLTQFLTLCRPACEMNRNIASAIVGCAKDRDDCQEFLRQTILKYNVQCGIVLDIVKGVCSQTVEMNREQTIISQEYLLHLLQVAEGHKIQIENLTLRKCFSRVNLGEKNIQLVSGSLMPVLKTLKVLEIREPGEDMPEENIQEIFQYAEMCSELAELRFYDCLLPKSLRCRSLKRLRSGKVQVRWYGCLAGLSCMLDFAKGTWRHNSSGYHLISDDEYEEEVKMFRKTYKL